jgi:L-rhamnose mutarotase
MTPAHDPCRRICFCLQVKRERLAAYEDRHRAVWPEMLEALRLAGWHNYSLFLRDDGLLVGYLETPDFEHALAEMADFFEGAPGLKADEQMRPLTEVFHLP